MRLAATRGGWLVLGAWALGCADPAPATDPVDSTISDSEPAESDALDSEPYELPPFTPPEVAQLLPGEVVEIEAAIAEFLRQARRLEFESVELAVQNIEALREPGCPEINNSTAGPLWIADCTTSAGRRFFGNFVYLVNEWDLFAEQTFAPLVETWGALAEPGWTPPAELPALTANGYQAYCTVGNDLRSAHFSGVYRDVRFQWGGLAARELFFGGRVIDALQTSGWITDEVEPNVSLLELRGASGGQVLRVHGAISELASAWSAVAAQDLVIGDAASGDVCPAEALGVVSVRSPQGAWYDLSFEGDSGVGCDGCGQVLRAGVPVGTACPDLSLYFPLRSSP